MLQTRHGQAERYTIVDVETDRIATSLNTVGEQVPKFLALARPASPDHMLVAETKLQ